MSYLLQASPLTRIFLPKWHALCLENPALLTSTKDPFDVVIPRASGAIKLTHNKPTLASELIPKTKARTVDDDEISPLVNWLTNPVNFETDIWGVVEIPIQDKVADAIMALIYDNDGKATQKLLEETRKNMAKGIKEAREIADSRVMRACGKIYNVVKSTVETMKKDGKGVYSPSYAEALALEVMRDTIAAKRKPDEKAAAMMGRAMSAIEQPV